MSRAHLTNALRARPTEEGRCTLDIWETGSRRVRCMIRCGCAVLWLGVPAGPVSSETLVDPTRPPSLASAGTELGDAGQVGAGPRIRSIVISPRRRFAVVDGRRVQVGDVVGESEVTAIEPDGIRLLGPEGEQRLSLYRVPVAKRPPAEE